MPLLGRKIYIPKTQDGIVKLPPGFCRIPITNEVFKTRDEYDKRLEFYRQPIWTCQCTGVTDLTYSEALRSEVSAREQLEDEFPVRLERVVLDLVHHNTCSLESLVDDVQTHLQNSFDVGDTVELKVQLRGKVIKGKIVKVTQSSADEWAALMIPKTLVNSQMKDGSSPSSDKENHVEEGLKTPLKHMKKTNPKNCRYNIHLSDEDKIISAVPGHEIIHTTPLPSWDLLKLFIRSNAIQTGSNPNSPWVVSEDLFTKFSLINKYDDSNLSPYKTCYETPKTRKRSPEERKNKTSKKRKLSDHFSSASSTKMKQSTLLDMTFNSKASKQERDDTMPSPEKVRMDHTYSSPIGKTLNKSSPKRSPRADSTKKSPAVAKKKGVKPALKTTKKGGVKKAKPKEVKKSKPRSKEDKVSAKQAVKDLPKKASSSEEDEVVDVDGVQESPRKTPFKKKLTDHFKSLQGNTPSEDEFKVTPKKTPKKEEKNTPKSKPKSKPPVKRASKVAKKALSGTPKKTVSPRKTVKTPVKKTKAAVNGTLKKTPVKSPRKATPKRSPIKKATPKKTPVKKGKASPAKVSKSKSLKQVTLFDLAGKKAKTPDSKVLYKLATPQSPRQLPIINKLIRAKKNKDLPLYSRLMAKAIRELTDKQIKNLKPDIRDEVTTKYEELKMKLKWKSMTPEERKEVIVQKREEKKKQREEERQKKNEEDRKMRLEQAKRYEDQDLKLKPVPTPKPVTMPEGLPNTLFGDIAMVVEFLNCYCGLLMPDDPYPVTADSLMKALVGGNTGFAYLSRVLVILLKTLLQDKIAEDYKELSMPLSQIPVNMHTASELLRLSLRHDDQQDNDDRNSSNGSEDYINEDDVPQDLVELLETSEFFELEPQGKLGLLVCLCHRILASYAVQDFMDIKQKVAARLWRDKIQTLKEKNEKIKEEKQKQREQREAERIQKEEELKLKAELAGENREAGSEVKPEEKPKEKRVRKKKEVKQEVKVEPEAAVDESLDLASVVKRRRLLAAKTKAEKEEQEKIEREKRIKGEEEYRKMRAQENFEKKFEDGIQQARLALRQVPIGTDRNHSRYWMFSSVTPGLFIEKGWVDSSVSYRTKKEARNGGDDNSGGEKTIPKVGQNLWFQYESSKELESLVDALDNQGIRESALCVEIKKRFQDVSKMIHLSRRSGPELRNSDGPKELLDSLKEDLQDMEVHIRQGNLGGVKDFAKWEERLKSATKLKDLGALIVESQAGVNPKFLQGIMAPPKPKPKPVEENEEDKEDEEEVEDDPGISEKVTQWIEAVETAPSMSRLHLLLSVCEACVRWEKSSENAKCKICRRKGDDEKLLLCDDCNQPFHLFCLRPALTAIPKGEWKCPACAPSTRRIARNRSYKGMDESDESSEEESDEESESNSDSNSDSDASYEHDEVCEVCHEGGELAMCARCPAAYHKDCHEPPMRNFPRGRWVCTPCMKPKRRAMSTTKQKEIAKKAAVALKRKKQKAKKRRLEEARLAKKAKIVFGIKIAEDIISKMLRYRDSGPFRTTPDQSEDPDYEETITSPIDLHMMQNKCCNKHYKNQQSFLDDVRLLLNNAKQYYENDQHVLLQAQKLEDFFVNLLKWNLPDAVDEWQQGCSQSSGANNTNQRRDHSYGKRTLRQHSR
ncbi:tyrosine-protein kinase BAZ1B-like isoform X3 [Asterias amurensis]|uniref:tyrosine-protein kinase BAZ1B-like isoform X3 n=1 Tax=Asterias amurensis TaxID=7602 RepID=UPI003AB65DCB